MKRKRTANPCKGCVWAERISEGLIFCPFHRCVKGELPTGQIRKERETPDGGTAKQAEGD